jgi:hypothetical protein
MTIIMLIMKWFLHVPVVSASRHSQHGRGCANCRVGYSCFDHTDCLSGLCSTGVNGNETFVPIMDEDDFYKRPGFRGTCLESVFTEEDSSAASNTAYALAFVMLLAVNLAKLL